MPAQIRSNISNILTRIVTRLKDWDALNTHVADGQIYIVSRPNRIKPLENDRDLLIYPGRFSNLGTERPGGGRHEARLGRRLSVLVRSRDELDETQRGTYLLKESGSHFSFEEEAFDALHNFWPEDDDGNLLTAHPLHNIDGGDPELMQRQTQGWIETVLTFEVEYILDLDQTVTC